MRNLTDCKKCGQPRDYAIKSGKRAGKLHTYCRKCLYAQTVDWAKRNHDRTLENQRRYWRDNPNKQLRARLRRYGVDEVWYKSQFEKQGGVCAICGEKETWSSATIPGEIYRLSVDHHHESGKVRGLLCNDCNHRLSVLEAHDWLPKAEAYLTQYQP